MRKSDLLHIKQKTIRTWRIWYFTSVSKNFVANQEKPNFKDYISIKNTTHLRFCKKSIHFSFLYFCLLSLFKGKSTFYENTPTQQDKNCKSLCVSYWKRVEREREREREKENYRFGREICVATHKSKTTFKGYHNKLFLSHIGNFMKYPIIIVMSLLYLNYMSPTIINKTKH